VNKCTTVQCQPGRTAAAAATAAQPYTVTAPAAVQPCLPSSWAVRRSYDPL
jgi:hypothetical protein